MAPRRKKRRLQAVQSEKAEHGEEPDAKEKVANPAFAKKGWKAVQLDFEMMKEFEKDGGLFFEEADPEEVGVEYLGGDRELMSTTKKRKKKSKTQATTNGLTSDQDKDLSAENERLRKELEALKGKSKQQEEELAVADLPEWQKFELHPKIMLGLSRLGFKTPTPVQARCLLPAIRQRKDIVGAAQTGSGKTLAFGLPILHHTFSSLDQETASSAASDVQKSIAEEGPRALVVLPTRELAVQVQAHLNAVSEGTPVHTECMVGGISTQKQKRLLRRRPAIVVGTPGRLFALLGLGEEADRCDWFREGLKCLRHLVLDEADRLVESGHFKELDKILELVYKGLARQQQLQTFVFSATLTLDPRLQQRRARGEEEWGGKVEALMSRIKFRETRAVFTADLTKPEGTKSDGNEEEASTSASKPPANLPEKLQFKELVCSDEKEKESMLAMWLLRRFRWGLPSRPKGGGFEKAVAAVTAEGTAPVGGRVILFVNAISSVQRLSSVLSILLESPSAHKVLSKVKMDSSGHQAPPGVKTDVLDLHSKMRQKDRLKRIEHFRKLKDAVLVCTDIAARGLDVPDVSAVLHYQAPRGSEVFVHRSGRTARAGREGESIAFMAPGDAVHWRNVYKAVGINKEQVENVDPSAEEIAAAKEASRLASDLEKKVHRSSKESSEKNWFRRAAEEAELMLDSDEEDRDKGRAAAPHHALWGLLRQLQARVRRPPRRLGATPLSRKQRLNVARRGKR